MSDMKINVDDVYEYSFNSTFWRVIEYLNSEVLLEDVKNKFKIRLSKSTFKENFKKVVEKK
jgi:hypothetical protein